MSTKDQRTINMVHYPLGDSTNPQDLSEYLDTIDTTAASKIGGTVGTTDNRLPRSDGTGGKTLQATGITVDDSNNMSGVVTLTADTLSPTNALAINKGGTANTTATAAFDALSPVTTRGDLITRDATNNIRLAIGAVGDLLTSDGTDPVWGLTEGQITLANGTNSDITLPGKNIVEIVGPTGAFTTTGFVAPTTNRLVFMYTRVTAGTWTIVNDATSTAANRIYTMGAGDIVTVAAGGAAVFFLYSLAQSRWLLFGGQG